MTSRLPAGASRDAQRARRLPPVHRLPGAGRRRHRCHSLFQSRYRRGFARRRARDHGRRCCDLVALPRGDARADRLPAPEGRAGALDRQSRHGPPGEARRSCRAGPAQGGRTGLPALRHHRVAGRRVARRCPGQARRRVGSGGRGGGAQAHERGTGRARQGRRGDGATARRDPARTRSRPQRLRQPGAEASHSLRRARRVRGSSSPAAC